MIHSDPVIHEKAILGVLSNINHNRPDMADPAHISGDGFVVYGTTIAHRRGNRLRVIYLNFNWINSMLGKLGKAPLIAAMDAGRGSLLGEAYFELVPGPCVGTWELEEGYWSNASTVRRSAARYDKMLTGAVGISAYRGNVIVNGPKTVAIRRPTRLPDSVLP